MCDAGCVLVLATMQAGVWRGWGVTGLCSACLELHRLGPQQKIVVASDATCMVQRQYHVCSTA
jgi:hypothetical protein